MQNQATFNNSGAVPSVTTRETAFNNLNNELGNILDRIIYLETRLSDFTIRTLGNIVPRDQVKQGQNTVKGLPNCKLAETSEKIDDIKVRLQLLEQTLEQIEGIA